MGGAVAQVAPSPVVLEFMWQKPQVSGSNPHHAENILDTV